MVGIHAIHRQLATITHMATDKNGNLWIGASEMGLIMPLLRKNLELVRQLDELKQIAFIAHSSGDMDWEQDICAKIEELEVKMI